MSARRAALGLTVLLQACSLPAAPPAPPPAPGERTKDEYSFAHLFFPERFPPHRMRVEETLLDPAFVVGWTRDALILRDGRAVPLAGVGDARQFSAALAEVTSAGVELRNDDVIGLVRVHHWCGNDSVRIHDARISVPELLRFLAERDASRMKTDDDGLVRAFAWRYGWDGDRFHAFCDWQRERTTRASPLAVADVAPDGSRTRIAVWEDGGYLFSRGFPDEGGSWAGGPVWGGRLPEDMLGPLRKAFGAAGEVRAPQVLQSLSDEDPIRQSIGSALAFLKLRHRE